MLLDRLFDNSAIPRGELWISGSVLKDLGYEQNLSSIIDLSRAGGFNICFLSYNGPVETIPVEAEKMGLLVQKAHNCNMTCGVTVDGPFERTVREHGFMEVMKWFYRKDLLQSRLEENASLAAGEIEAARKAGADLVILCDDIAYSHGLYFSPDHFKELLLPLYQALKNSAGPNTPLGFHSDGDIRAVASIMAESGYTAFSIEPEAMDLDQFLAGLPDNIVLLAGIKAEWLVAPWGEDTAQKAILPYISRLRSACRLILASSCGIIDRTGLERLKNIYKSLDEGSNP